MGFHHALFLLLFLPVFAGVYFISPPRFRNLILLLFSLVFYYLVDGYLIVVLLFSAFLNYLCGRIIFMGHRKSGLYLALGMNLLLLLLFKFLISRPGIGSSVILTAIFTFFYTNSQSVILPLGISYFTFRAISYIVDSYRGKIDGQDSLLHFITWFTMFPVIQSGPIARYPEMSLQLRSRMITRAGILTGLERFIIGLIKKVVIAGTFSMINLSFSRIPVSDMSTPMAWAGLLFYTLEIYYDFSGYTDMAIGLGLMAGFVIPENFRFPYTAKDIRDFWRRWHITLSSWLRDYLFLPLAYFLSRKLPLMKYARIRTEHIIYTLSTFITFLVCGLWHGLSVKFAVWGLYFAFFLIIEQLFLGRWMKRWPVLFRHSYTVSIVSLSWVIFRAENLEKAVIYFEKLFRFDMGMISVNSYLRYFTFNYETLVVLIFAVLFAMPLYPSLRMKFVQFANNGRVVSLVLSYMVVGFIFGFALFIALSWIAVGSYSPSVYVRF
jgi:alginate O-acetyltransferase complex protein AlgI